MVQRIYRLGTGNAWTGEVREIPKRISKTLEVFCSYSFCSSSSWQPCSLSSSLLSLATGRWHTESACLGLCLLCLAALGNPAGIQRRSRHCHSSLSSARMVTSSTPSFPAVAGVSAAVVFARKTDRV